MKSVRDRNLPFFGEFIYELVAQWIITGKITFNPLPKDLELSRRKAWGRPRWDNTRRSRVPDAEFDQWNEALQHYAERYTDYLDYVFQGLQGRIFIF
jgi:hypothetical protein